MRWMEALVERPDASRAGPSLANAWMPQAERVPDLEAPVVEAERIAWPTRALNFMLALLALISLLPVFVLIAVLIRLTSRGPVF